MTNYPLAVWLAERPWLFVVAGVVVFVTAFVVAIFRGVQVVNGVDAELEARVAAELESFRRHCDEAMHIGNADDCVMCEFDRNRAPREDPS